MTSPALNLFSARKKLFISILFFLSFGEIFSTAGQNSTRHDILFEAEKASLLQHIELMATDNTITNPVVKNFESKLGDLLVYIDRNRKLKKPDKEKAKRSLAWFLQETNNFIQRKKMGLYDLSEAIGAYENVLVALVQNKPLMPVLEPLESVMVELAAASFTQYREHVLLEDVATYKRVAASPEYIIQFLEAKPTFRFADSLLVEAVSHDPMKIVYYLRKNNPSLAQRIRNAPNRNVRQIALVSGDKNAPELALFAPLVAEGKISTEEVLLARAAPTKYFQLMVNSLDLAKSPLASGLLRNGIRDKALAFYVNDINELHNSADAVRFASVKDLRAKDLYYIITSCGEELYTSSYLGLYKRLVAAFNGQAADSLFDMVKWRNFHVFIRMAANYNVLEDFLHKLSPEKLNEVLGLYIANIETDQRTAVDRAMDIADSFGALNPGSDILALFRSEIGDNLLRCKNKRHLMGIRLYSILDDMLQLTQQKDGFKKIWSVLGDYETLKRGSLENAKGDITEVVLFYGDEDGVASYQNFIKNYNDKLKWEVTRNGQWVSIRSLAGHPLVIYANLPLDMQGKADLAAQDNLFSYLEKNGVEPSILVHRGHSYHLDKTLKRLTPSVKLSILGSCGGYNKSISIASINPDVQVIGSKQTGSKAVNDPILDLINELLSNGQDLQWPAIWEKLGARFRKDPAMLSVFNEYFPPADNLGLFVLKLFRGNKRLL